MAKAASQGRKPAAAAREAKTVRARAQAPTPAAEHVKAVALKRTEAMRPTQPARPEPAQREAGRRSEPAWKASVPAEKPAARRSTASLVLAGIVGGLVVFGGMSLLQWAVVNPARNNNGLQQQFTALNQEVDALAQALEQRETEGADGATAETIAALEQRLAALESGLEGSGGDQETLATLQEQAQADEAARRELASRLDAVEAAIEDTTAEENAARAFAAAALQSAIDRGGPFGAELDAYASVTQDAGTVETLEPFAGEGVPTRSELVERFPDVARQMLLALNAGSDNAGILDRLVTSARSVVTVRPTGEIEGDGAEAIIARMEARLVEGDLAGAIGQWETLPEAAKAASQEFADDLRARAAAEQILEETLAAASGAAAEQTN